MPDAPDSHQARLVARLLTTAGIVTLLGAVAAYATGDEIHLRGAVVRTHTDAVWVLGVLGAALVVVAFAMVIISTQDARLPARDDVP